MIARRFLFPLLLGVALSIGLYGAAVAKLPPPTDEQKAKAAETKAKADEAAKKEAELLTKVQDKSAARYIADQAKLGKVVTPTPIVAPPPQAAAPMTAQEKAPNTASAATPHNAETGNAGKDKPAAQADKPMQREKPTGGAAPAK